MSREAMDSETLARFWSKVDKTGECWEWVGAKVPDGYGMLWVVGKNRLAHRLSYGWHVGPIPDGMLIDHICHNRGCVRPEHLRAVTVKQNAENLSAVRASSGARGVSWHKVTRKWQARVMHNQTNIHVGYFASIEEAEGAVKAKRNELYTHNDLDRQAA